MARKSRKKSTKRSSRDGRTARGEFKRKLWAYAANILDGESAPEASSVMKPAIAPEGEGAATFSEEQLAQLKKGWKDVVDAVAAKSRKRA